MQHKILILGAGPKAVALATKHRVLGQKGLSLPPYTVIERATLAAHWDGQHGFTDGDQELVTPPEQDLGFPYTTDWLAPLGLKAAQLKEINESIDVYKRQLRIPSGAFVWIPPEVRGGSISAGFRDCTERLLWKLILVPLASGGPVVWRSPLGGNLLPPPEADLRRNPRRSGGGRFYLRLPPDVPGGFYVCLRRSFGGALWCQIW